MSEAPRSGIPGLDRLIDGLRIGDNVVWIAPRKYWTALLSPFVEETERPGLCYFSVDSPAHEVLARFAHQLRPGRFVLVDCHADMSDEGIEPTLNRERTDVNVVADPRDSAAVQVLMKELEDDLGPRTGYVFESLTGMQQLWGADASLAFFLRHCPRLYDLDTVAYWVLDPSEHDQGFIQRIHQVTQVILEVSDGDPATVRVVKADARPATVVGRTASLEQHSDGSLRVVPSRPSGRGGSGELLKRRRMERGMSQTDLARRLGITPSALSQAERGKRGLSAETMAVAWRELGVEGDGKDENSSPSYVVARRGARLPEPVVAGVEGERIIQRPSGFEAHSIAFAPGASGRRPPIATKRPEFVLVTEGVLQLRIGEAKEVLHAGDAILIDTQPLSAWRNPSPTVTRATWIVVP